MAEPQRRHLKSLSAVFSYEDEWPSRLGEFIIWYSKWCVAHPEFRGDDTEEIVSFLRSATFEKGLIHESCIETFGVDSTGRPVHTFKSSIVFKRA